MGADTRISKSMILSMVAEIFSNLLSLIAIVPLPLFQTIPSQVIVWHGSQTDYKSSVSKIVFKSKTKIGLSFDADQKVLYEDICFSDQTYTGLKCSAVINICDVLRDY